MAIDLTKKDQSLFGNDFKTINKDLQGNILKSHGRGHTSHIFFCFKPNKVAEAKAFLKGLAITSAAQQAKDSEATKADGVQRLFTGLYLTGACYQYLGVSDAKTPADSQFRSGMKASAGSLNDTPSAWESGYQGDIHGMILLAMGGTDRKNLDVETKAVSDNLQKIASVVATEKGDGIKNANDDDIEHFGYVDGISQPRFFIEELNPDRATVWNPAFSWDLILVDDPAGKTNAFGSYFVFRKLEQNVKGFKDAEAALGNELFPGASDEAKELAGAMLVGRFENGMPVILSDKDDSINGHDVFAGFIGKLNDFTYDGDTQGAKCPFHSHIRKTNPRGDSSRQFGVSLESEMRHTMARRGIIYGKRKQNAKTKELEDQPTAGVGLLFMSFQQNIATQFEFIQQSWANNDNFVKGSTGGDGIIGQGITSGGMHQYPRVYGDASTIATANTQFQDFVTTKGGEYFFAPSLSGIKAL